MSYNSLRNTTRLFTPSSKQGQSDSRPYFIFKSQSDRDAKNDVVYTPQGDIDGWLSESGPTPVWYYREPVSSAEKKQNRYVAVGAQAEFGYHGEEVSIYGYSWAVCRESPPGGCPNLGLINHNFPSNLFPTEYYSHSSSNLTEGYLWQYTLRVFNLTAQVVYPSISSSVFVLTLTPSELEDANGTLALSSHPFEGYTPTSPPASGDPKSPALLPMGMGIDFALTLLDEEEVLDPGTDRLLAQSIDPSFTYQGQWTLTGMSIDDGAHPESYPSYSTAHVGDSVTWTFFSRSVVVKGTYGGGLFAKFDGSKVNLSVTLDSNAPIFVVENNVESPKPPYGVYRTLYQNTDIPQLPSSSGGAQSANGTALTEKHTLTIRVEDPTDVDISIIGAVYTPSFQSLAQLRQWMEDTNNTDTGAGQPTGIGKNGDAGGASQRVPMIAGVAVGSVAFILLALVGCRAFILRQRKMRQQGVRAIDDSTAPIAFIKSYEDINNRTAGDFAHPPLSPNSKNHIENSAPLSHPGPSQVPPFGDSIPSTLVSPLTKAWVTTQPPPSSYQPPDTPRSPDSLHRSLALSRDTGIDSRNPSEAPPTYYTTSERDDLSDVQKTIALKLMYNPSMIRFRTNIPSKFGLSLS